MKILVLNCGSSSLKYRLIAMPEEKELAGGEAQRVGPPTADPARIYHRVNGSEKIIMVEMKDHATAYIEVMKILERENFTPDAVGHSLVHGAEIFTGSVRIDNENIERLESLNNMAPWHNPPAVKLIKKCLEHDSRLPQIAVFDTSYHSTIPDYAATYAIPQAIARELNIRKYGFHGTSHRFVVTEAAKFLGIKLSEFNAVSCHLGSGGASLCAVKGGKSIDNTMGFSPLQGLIMSTRCGDLDSALVLKILSMTQGNSDQVEDLLNKTSGVLGLSGTTGDIRDIIRASADDPGNSRNQSAEEIYLWRIRKYLGAYLAAVGQAHAVIFTDTIGETVPMVRWAVSAGLQIFGLNIDSVKNEHPGPLPLTISADDSRVKAVVVATNEELEIARQAYMLLDEQPSATNTGAHYEHS
ncbi:MAG: acetate/propionate family kinase [Victivallaceae bacterium]